jgi:hypothetical protein
VCVRLQKFAHGSEMVKTLFQNLPTGKRKPWRPLTLLTAGYEHCISHTKEGSQCSTHIITYGIPVDNWFWTDSRFCSSDNILSKSNSDPNGLNWWITVSIIMNLQVPYKAKISQLDVYYWLIKKTLLCGVGQLVNRLN